MRHLLVVLTLALTCNVTFAKTLKVGVMEGKKNFYPIHQRVGESNFIRNLISPPIIAVSKGQKWTCIVCKRIPTIENGGVKIDTFETNVDGKEVEQDVLKSKWEISDSFYWDDGKPVTGLDIKFTLEYLKANGHHLPISKIVVNHKKPRQFDLWFDKPRPDFYQTLAISILPHQKAKLIHSLQMDNTDIVSQLANSKGTSYGPYRLSADKENPTLVENSYYKGLKNDFKTIEIQFHKSLESLSRNLGSADLDMVADGELEYKDIKNLLQKPSIRSKWKFVHSLSPVTDILIFNLKNPYLADLQLRKAIFHSIDRESLLSDIFDNYGSIAPLPPYEAANTFVGKSTYNLLQARRILESSGWDMTAKASESSRPRLELNLIFTNSPLKKKIANRVRSNLGSLGISVKLKPLQSKDEFLERTRKGLFKDLALISIKTFPDMPLADLYHSQAIPKKKNDFRGNNFASWNNYRIDQALDKRNQSLLKSERAAALLKVSKIYREDLPSIPLLVRPHFGLINSNLVNVHFPGHGYHSSLFSSGWSSMESEKGVIF